MDVSVSGFLGPRPHHPSLGLGASVSGNKAPEKNNPMSTATARTSRMVSLPILS